MKTGTLCPRCGTAVEVDEADVIGALRADLAHEKRNLAQAEDACAYWQKRYAALSAEKKEKTE